MLRTCSTASFANLTNILAGVGKLVKQGASMEAYPPKVTSDKKASTTILAS
jgi:hypothetical protein